MNHIILHVAYRCQSGKAEEFIRAVKESGLQDLVRREDGCLQYDYHLSLEHHDTVVLLEHWRDNAALSTHLAQPHMNKLGVLKNRFVEDTAIERFEVTI